MFHFRNRTLITYLGGSTCFGMNMAYNVPNRGSNDTTCSLTSYGPFKLSAQQTRHTNLLPIYVSHHDTNISTEWSYSSLTVCPGDKCGIIPNQWLLQRNFLSVSLPDTPNGRITVNAPLNVNSNVTLVTSNELWNIAHVTSPDYCIVRGPKGPLLLSPRVESSTDAFALCTSTPHDGTSRRFHVRYKPDFPDLDSPGICMATRLVVQPMEASDRHKLTGDLPDLFHGLRGGWFFGPAFGV